MSKRFYKGVEGGKAVFLPLFSEVFVVFFSRFFA
jgi:hypothetical protein